MCWNRVDNRGLGSDRRVELEGKEAWSARKEREEDAISEEGKEMERKAKNGESDSEKKINGPGRAGPFG